jgi:hypothetical protein
MLAADVPAVSAHAQAHIRAALHGRAERGAFEATADHGARFAEDDESLAPGLWPAHDPRRASGLTVDRRSASSCTSAAQSLAQCWCGRRAAASRKRRFRPKQRRPSGATAGVLLCRRGTLRR